MSGGWLEVDIKPSIIMLRSSMASVFMKSGETVYMFYLSKFCVVLENISSVPRLAEPGMPLFAPALPVSLVLQGKGT